MAGYSYCSSSEFPEPLTSKVARLETQRQQDHESIQDLSRKMDKLMWGVIAVLLATLGQIIFKH